MKVSRSGETARRSHLISTPRPTSSCTKIGRKCRILNVIYCKETARRSPLSQLLEQRRVVPKLDENAEFTRSAIAEKPRDAWPTLISTPRTTSSCSKIRRKCRIFKVSYPWELRNRAILAFDLHSSNNVELFQNWPKMHNSEGQLSRRKRATFVFKLHSSTNVEVYENERKCRIFKVSYPWETAQLSPLISTPRTTSSCSKTGRKCIILKVSYRGENARRLCLNSTPRPTSSCTKIGRKCRIFKVSYRGETARRSTDFKVHCSNRVELFQNSTKMHRQTKYLLWWKLYTVRLRVDVVRWTNWFRNFSHPLFGKDMTGRYTVLAPRTDKVLFIIIKLYATRRSLIVWGVDFFRKAAHGSQTATQTEYYDKNYVNHDRTDRRIWWKIIRS